VLHLLIERAEGGGVLSFERVPALHRCDLTAPSERDASVVRVRFDDAVARAQHKVDDRGLLVGKQDVERAVDRCGTVHDRHALSVAGARTATSKARGAADILAACPRKP